MQVFGGRNLDFNAKRSFFLKKIRYKIYLLFVVIESHGCWNFSDICELETSRWRVLFQIPFLGDIAVERAPFSFIHYIFSLKPSSC